jgi:hypothetical protein
MAKKMRMKIEKKKYVVAIRDKKYILNVFVSRVQSRELVFIKREK